MAIWTTPLAELCWPSADECRFRETTLEGLCNEELLHPDMRGDDTSLRDRGKIGQGVVDD
jgi:hypothetical protein